MLQKQLLRVAGRLARPSITATQMLDSMVSSPRPTRAEVADIANAILDGTDAVMLSQETAIGGYPVEAIETMASVAERTEHGLPYRTWNEERVRRDARDPAYTVAYSACAAARDLHLAALVVPTLSGRSARLISAHRPQVPIFALSPGKETVRRCSLMWGVQAGSMRRHEITEALIADAARRVVELGMGEVRGARRDHRGTSEWAAGTPASCRYSGYEASRGRDLLRGRRGRGARNSGRRRERPDADADREPDAGHLWQIGDAQRTRRFRRQGDARSKPVSVPPRLPYDRHGAGELERRLHLRRPAVTRQPLPGARHAQPSDDAEPGHLRLRRGSGAPADVQSLYHGELGRLAHPHRELCGRDSPGKVGVRGPVYT